MVASAAELLPEILRAVSGLDAEPLGERAPLLARYAALVDEWNARIDLTAARSRDELVDLLFADALVLAAKLPAGARVVDVGSGAGAPGLSLALARPDLELTLVEPLQKRVAFLRTAIGALVPKEARRPRVLRSRGEAVARGGERFEVAISRATLPPPAWLALGAELAEKAVWVLLAREEPPSHAGWAIEEDLRYAWPLTGAARRAVKFVPSA